MSVRGAGQGIDPAPLTLDLLRHGIAAPAEPGEDDADRRLAPEGRLGIERLAARLASVGSNPGRVLASPLRRAQETARIVVTRLDPGLAVEELAELEPECEPDALIAALGREGVMYGHALLVGHQPQLGRLASFLLGAPQRLAPGDLLRVECRPAARRGAGTLVLEVRQSDL